MVITLCALAGVALVACGRDGGAGAAPAGTQAAAMADLRPEFPFDGRIVFQSDIDGDAEIYLLTSAGVRRLTDNDWQDEYPLWSPDGTRISFSANPGGNYDIFAMNADGTGAVPLVATPRDEIEQAWSPDGRRIAYTEEIRRPLGRRYNLWLKDLASDRAERLAPEFGESSALPHFSPVAPLLAFTGKRGLGGGWDVFALNLETREIRALTENGQTCRPRFSPDGRRLAYVSHEADHKGDIWLMGPDGSAPRRLTVRDETHDYFPSWSPDGRSVVFCSNAESMYAHEGTWDLYIVDAETGESRLLLGGPARHVFPDWTK